MESLVIIMFVVAWVIKQTKKAQTSQASGKKLQFEYAIQAITEQIQGKKENPSTPFQIPMPSQQDISLPMTNPGLESHLSIEYEGSYSTLEGMDTCDSTLGHLRETSKWALDENEPEAEDEKTWTFQLTQDALIQNVIMSEVFTRPSQRKHGRFYV